ncbi:MAG TPA: hypothetical protein ACFYEK_06155 [Candidatus Wunengus sp. YC60]|uniref:hypothetical protein n=1 Tax=Candidatus Wunengus sp. YC60 TaxID=3367697 RepID=UPI004028A09F
MAFRMNTDLKNYLTETVVLAMAGGTFGTAGTGSGRLYGYARTLNADTAISQSAFGTIGDNLGWGTDSWAATAGTASLAVEIVGTSGSNTTALWGSLSCIYVGYTGSAATFRIDGTCGTSGTHDFIFDDTSAGTDGTISFGTCNLGVGP